MVNEDAIYSWSGEVRGKLGGQNKIPHIDPTVDGEMTLSLLRFIGREAEAGGSELDTGNFRLYHKSSHMAA